MESSAQNMDKGVSNQLLFSETISVGIFFSDDFVPDTLEPGTLVESFS